MVKKMFVSAAILTRQNLLKNYLYCFPWLKCLNYIQYTCYSIKPYPKNTVCLTNISVLDYKESLKYCNIQYIHVMKYCSAKGKNATKNAQQLHYLFTSYLLTRVLKSYAILRVIWSNLSCPQILLLLKLTSITLSNILHTWLPVLTAPSDCLQDLRGCLFS